MRRSLLTVLLAALLSAAGLLVASPAAACSCGVADTATYFADADAVFTGSLVSRDVDHPDWPMTGSADPALHVFAVDEVFKGEVHEIQGVVSAAEGSSCGLTLSGDGPHVVFAMQDQNLPDGQYRADSCGGTTTLAAVADDLSALAGDSGSPPARGAAGLEGAGLSPVATALLGAGALAVVAVGWVVVRRRRRRQGMR